MTSPSKDTVRVEENPFTRNEHGLWCPACGELIAYDDGVDDEGFVPNNCRTCGFPDFEDGMGYFTDDK